ncbi:MAG: hypothetical protein OXH85_12925 [Truepera sp.]|nr:hypothetical protein [Truepera sp.]
MLPRSRRNLVDDAVLIGIHMVAHDLSRLDAEIKLHRVPGEIPHGETLTLPSERANDQDLFGLPTIALLEPDAFNTVQVDRPGDFSP